MNTKHTPGPWAWYGDAKYGNFYLATTHSGRRYVMDFVRMGLNAAQPRFQKNGLMENGRDLCTFEVSNAVGYEAGKADGDTYRYTVDGFDHPDARLIAAAPELLEALINLERRATFGTTSPDQLREARTAIAKATQP